MFGRSGICITKFDYKRLINLLKNYSAAGKLKDVVTAKKLMSGIRKAKKVDSEKIASNYVTMNSLFEVKDLGTPRKFQFRLVYPDDADKANCNLSVLAPSGIAVLGSKEGDVIKWEYPTGEKYYQINRIIYQPEAAGHYHL